MATLPPLSEEERGLIARVEQRRLALSGDMAQLRLRYEEVLRWANPPWDAVSKRLDPRPEQAAAAREGTNKLHTDLVWPTITRWAVLEAGVTPTIRVRPKYVAAPVPSDDADQTWLDRQTYEIDRAIAQNQSSQMENLTAEWMEQANFGRTLYWAAWAKEAFGKGILRSGWDPEERIPTCELMENPSQVYYGWSRRYGRRKLSWVIVVEQISPAEANRLYGLDIPTDEYGAVDWSSWSGYLDEGEMDQRAEQQQEIRRYVYAEESWELTASGCRYALVVAGRVVDGPTEYPWRRLPFHVLENEHIPTYSHGRSIAEVMIPLNAAYDDMLDREAQVIDFESGPRYLGVNFGEGSEVDLPDPFELLPMAEGRMVQQLDTRVDFWPAQVHGNELREAKYKATGLTPIAWGMSPNAQTSGRSMTAEWRAVELPLIARIVNMSPEVRDIVRNWWDYAEAYLPDVKAIGDGYRRFSPIWSPLDIRDKTEKTLDIIQRLQANIIDPETAIEESGLENVDEIMARIRLYLTDPVWNPLRYQQLLTLDQLELAIREKRVQVAMLEQQAQQAGAMPAEEKGGANGRLPGTSALLERGQTAAVQGAQGPAGPVGPAQNQPGQSPGPGGLPMDVSLLSRTPLVGGMGSQVQVPLQSSPGGGPPAGPSPTSGTPVR